MLEFRTLGSIELRGLDERARESALLHPKRLALLAYLCASPPLRLVRRDTLVELLWPEQDEAHARGALRQELYQLRRALGAGVLRGDRADAVGIDTQRLWCDVCEFESALECGRCLEALELWRGEFLPGLHVKGEGFQRWLDQERDRLRRRAAEAARLLATEAEKSDDGAAAVRWARRLTALAPYDETAWQHLIGQLDRQGDRAGALRAYDDLVAWLASEIGVEPSPETSLLVEHIRQRREAFSGSARSLSWAPRPEGERRAGFAARSVIGLLSVQNRTGDPTLDTLAERVTDRLTQGLAGAMFVDVAPIGEEERATAVVSATLYRQGEGVEVVSRLAEPGENGRLVEMPRAVQLSPDASEEELNTLVAHVLVSVAAHYDPRFDAASTPERALPIQTPLWEAYLEYLQGSELFGRSRHAEAHRHLLKAYELDPDFVKAGIFAAIALASNGEPADADSLASSVMSARRPLCPYEQGLGDWFIADLRGRRAEAHRVAIEWTRVTGSPVAWIIAGREALRMNRPYEALRLLEGIEWGHGWWRNLSVRFETTCAAHHVLGSHETELLAGLDARARFPGSLEAIGAEARARAALGQSDLVLGLVDEALTLPGGLTSPAYIGWIAAQELDAHGGAAAGVRRTVLEWLTGLAEPSPVDQRLRVRILLEIGDVDGAARALAALGPQAHLESLELAGLVAAQQGRTGAALQALATLEGLDNPYLSGRHQLAAAGIRTVLDPPETAMATLRRALAAGLPFGVELHALPTLQPLAGRADFRALLRPRE